MTTGPSLPGPGALLDSAAFARAYALTVIGAVFASHLIERLAGRVTYVTILAGLCVIGAGILIARRRELSLVRLVPTTLILYLAWTLASAAWSTDRGASVSSWVATAAIAFLAVTLGAVRDTLQTARAVGDVLRLLLGVSLALEVLSGILLDTPLRFLGIQGNIAQAGSIQGIFGTRNLLGFVAVIALITFVIEYRTQSVRPGVAIASVILAGGLAVLSDSPTVLVLAVGVALTVGALAWVRHTPPQRRGAVQWVLAAIVVIGLLAAYAARHPIIAWLGAGTDFSVRARLWTTMIEYIRDRPVQGWGWFGPWTSDLPFVFINFRLDERHATGLNAYFDVLLQVGWVGLLLFLALAGIALVRSWLDAGERRSVVYAWTPLILVTLLLDSMFESFTLAGLGWFLLVLCAVRAGQSRSWRERLQVGTGSAPLPQGSPESAG